VGSPFGPKGEAAEWRLIYDELLSGSEFGDLITYAELDAVLGRRFLDNRKPVYRARRELGEERRRWLEAVAGRGYRVVQANEHLRIAQQHKRKARRQLTHMTEVTSATDLGRLTSDELAAFDAQTRINAALVAIAFSHEQRLARIETTLRNSGML
jgi:hypothetical protein